MMMIRDLEQSSYAKTPKKDRFFYNMHVLLPYYS